MQTLQAYKCGIIPLNWASLLKLTFNFTLIKNYLFLCHCMRPILWALWALSWHSQIFLSFGFLIIMIFLTLVGGIFTLLQPHSAEPENEVIVPVPPACCCTPPGQQYTPALIMLRWRELQFFPTWRQMPSSSPECTFISTHTELNLQALDSSKCIKHMRNNLVQQLEDTHCLTCNQGFSFCFLPGKERHFQRYDKWDQFSLAFCFKKCIFTVRWGNTSL